MATGILDDTKQGFGSIGKQLVKQVVTLPKSSGKAVVRQITPTPSQEETGEKLPSPEKPSQPSSTDASAQDIIKKLYESSASPVENSDQKATQEQQKLAEVRSRLADQHKREYYDPTFNPEFKKPEETVEERVEKQDQEAAQKRWELQKEEEKKAPISVTRAKNKTETFRGPSG